MARENLFIYMTSVVVKLEKILVKIRYLLENKIPNHLNFFYVLNKQTFFYLEVKYSIAS